jgi:hypothetical protein
LRNILVTDVSTVVTSTPGYYFISYDVTDPSGNIAEQVQRLVHVLESVTGVGEINQNNNVSVYPNPSNGIVTIASSSNILIKRIKVIDVIGKEILNRNVEGQNVTINLDVKSGMYLLIMEQDNGQVSSRKLVVE